MRTVLPKGAFWWDKHRVYLVSRGKCAYCPVEIFDFWKPVNVNNGYERGLRYHKKNGHFIHCERPASTRDHVVPRAKGGAKKNGNIVLCCGYCNQAKGCKTVREFVMGASLLPSSSSACRIGDEAHRKTACLEVPATITPTPQPPEDER